VAVELDAAIALLDARAVLLDAAAALLDGTTTSAGGHAICPVLEPVQSAPPVAGKGLLQVRDRVLLMVPL